MSFRYNLSNLRTVLLALFVFAIIGWAVKGLPEIDDEP